MFLLKIVVFITIAFAVDRLLTWSLQFVRPIDYELFVDSKREFFNRRDSYDIIILGDSQIADAVDPRVLSKKCGLSAFNLAIYGASPFANYYTLLAALKHLEQKPKAIMIGTTPETFKQPLLAGKYTPIIVQDWLVNWEMNLRSTKPFHVSNFFTTVRERYLFQSLMRKFSGAKYTPTREIHNVYNGYLESHNQIAGTDWNEYKDSTAFSNAKQCEFFEKTIQLAMQNSIQVIIVHPPMWFNRLDAERETDQFKEFTLIIDSLRRKYALPVFNDDFEVLRGEVEQKDFLNTVHMNYFGAQKFSARLSEWLNENNSDLCTTKANDVVE